MSNPVALHLDELPDWSRPLLAPLQAMPPEALVLSRRVFSAGNEDVGVDIHSPDGTRCDLEVHAHLVRSKRYLTIFVGRGAEFMNMEPAAAESGEGDESGLLAEDLQMVLCSRIEATEHLEDAAVVKIEYAVINAGFSLRWNGRPIGTESWSGRLLRRLGSRRLRPTLTTGQRQFEPWLLAPAGSGE